MNSTTDTAKRSSIIVKLAVGLGVIGTMVFGTPGMAQRAGKGEANTSTIMLRVYDYSQVGPKELQAAEEEAARILAQAGVIAHWTDCPTKHADVERYPGCTGAASGTEYTLLLLSSSMTAVQEKSQDALGNASDCEHGNCIARVYYDRITKLAGGNSAPSYVLAGRVMAREVGQLLIGVTYRSRSGIMSASWTHQQLGLLANPEILFSSAEASAIKARLAEREQAAATRLAQADADQLRQPR